MKIDNISPAAFFSASLLIGYGLVPVVAYVETANRFYLDVLWLAIVSALSVFLASKVRIFDLPGRLQKIKINANHFLSAVFLLFFTVVAYTVATAPAVPLLAWFSGADTEVLVDLREQFLKARVGWESILPYFNALLTSTFVPYALALMFSKRHPWRWRLFYAFLVYCLIFIEKVYFIKAIIPLAVVMFGNLKANRGTLFGISLASLALVYGLAVVSGFGSGESIAPDEFYFSNTYRPSGTGEYLVWRAFSVPVFTAADSLSYYLDTYRSEPLYGATTGIFSSLFGTERLYFEREVFAYQWGQTESGTGSANAAFFIDAYINFGILGVVLISIAIGRIFNYMRSSDDIALRAIWPLFAFGLYVSGFFGNLFSSGFLLIFLFSALFVVRSPVRF
ncbi:hypothetical protein [Propionivibrio sp.]|uniref:hypothetical protein n=1 Tax=Propionivibrio sp. TaxID=2212460 RepID=UPI0039E71816